MLKLFLALLSILLLSPSFGATILINGVPVKNLYVDSEGRLYLTPGPGRKPVKIEIPQSGTPVASKSRKLKVGGTAYIHLDADLGGGDHRSAFRLTRNYVELRGYFNEKDYFRTTVDVKQEQGSNGNMDGSYVVRLKYAYVYLHDVLPHTGVEIGLSHRPWIDWEEHHGWLHRDVEETLIENHSGAGLINSADFGINFRGNYRAASWEFGVFNGEGYHATESSRHFGKSVEGRLSLNVFRGFTLSAHTVHSFDHGGKGMDRHIYQLHAVYNTPYFLVAAQYLWDRDDFKGSRDVNRKGYSLNGDLKLKPFTGYPFGLLARFDRWDTDDDKPDSVRRHFVYGAFYRFSPFIRFSLVHDRVIAEDNAGDDSSTLMSVMQVNW